jgi:hypothetical protein
VHWPAAGSSDLAAALQKAASRKPALGIMVRFTAYVNVYFKNGILNGNSPQPRTYEDLAAALTAAWNEFNSTGKTDLFFSNPCYSHVVGTLGVWNEGEVATVPGGRFLAAANRVAPQVAAPVAAGDYVAAPDREKAGHQKLAVLATASSAPPTVPLGPAVVQVDKEEGADHARPEQHHPGTGDGRSVAVGPGQGRLRGARSRRDVRRGVHVDRVDPVRALCARGV